MVFDVFKINQLKTENEQLKQRIIFLEYELHKLQTQSSSIDELSDKLNILNQRNQELTVKIETLEEEKRILLSKTTENVTSTVKSGYTHPKQILSYKNARMLQYWDGRNTKSTPSSFQLQDYGTNLLSIVKTFLENGFLRISTPRENVNYAGVAELKSALRTLGDKVSGNKSELLQRVLKYDDSILEKYFQDCHYVLTDTGKEQIDNNSIYFYNDSNYCRLTITELKELKNKYPNYSDTEIFVLTFKSKLTQDVLQQNWRNYEEHLWTLSKILKNSGQYQETLQYLWDMALYKLSGISYSYFFDTEIKTRIQEYGYLTLDTRMINEIDNCITNLEMDIPTFSNYIKNNCFFKSPKLPFNYFFKENVLNIICDKLNGVEFSADTCVYKHNIPNPNLKDYIYNPLNYSEFM